MHTDKRVSPVTALAYIRIRRLTCAKGHIINRRQRKTENNNDGKLKGKAIEHKIVVEDLILNACYLVVHDMSVLNITNPLV